MSGGPGRPVEAGGDQTPTQRWSAVLTALEADITAAEAALATGQLPEGSALVLPSHMDPLPVHLTSRAWQAHDRAIAVSAALEHATASTASARRAVAAQRSERPASVYVDARC